MTGRVIEAPVLIVGAGPVGLALALDLSWRGIECLVLERTDGTITNPKTGHIAARTMEFCRRWGIVERVRHCGFPEDYELSVVFCTSLRAHLLAKHYYPALREDRPAPGSPERKQRGPQMYFDPLLAAAVRESGRAKIHYRCEFLGFEQRADDVVARVRDTVSGEEVRVVSRYLAACDGPGSGVRSALGIGLEGDPTLNYSVAVYIRSPGLVERHDKGQAERYMFIGPEGTWGNLTVVDGRDLWRLTVQGTREKFEPADFDAPGWVRRCMGAEDIAFELLSVVPWRRSRLVASRYSEGRVFLAGDSAHTMSPTGGFGMNTGMGDAVDLGWKLQGALRGWAGPGLLASYDVERRPVGARNANAAADNFHRQMSASECSRIREDSAEGDAVRARVGESIRAATQTEWECHGVVLGYRYEGSPIIVPDGSAPTADDPAIYEPTARPGHRAPHAWLADGRSTIDLFGREFVLLRLGVDPPDPAALLAAARRRGVPLAVADVADPAIAGLYERRLVLVRPDGHSCWRGDSVPRDPGRVIDTIRGAG